jgi:Carboxypeptidase regulatory-like domain
MTLVAASFMTLVLAAQTASAQQPPPAQEGTGVVAGGLADAGGQPVRKAQVRLVSVPARSARTTTSDAEGRFSFTGLPPGEYTVSASKPGHLDAVFGARRPGLNAPGTPIRLAAGQKIDTITLKLPRGSVITGLVLDEFGDPAFNVPVRAVRFIFENGRRALTAGGNGTTDDRGMYRIAGLMPGEYLVSAVPRDTVATAALNAEAARDRQVQFMAKGGGNAPGLAIAIPTPASVGYVPIYYPGTPAGASASTVRVAAGEEVSGIDIRLHVIETVSISGKLSSEEGALPQSRLQLIDSTMPLNLVGVWFRDMRPDGTFAFHGLPPGPYIVKAFGTPGGEIGVAGGDMWASADVTAGPGGANNVELRMRRGVTVSGTLSLSELPASVDLTRARVNLYPIPSPSDWEMGILNMRLDAAGKFSAPNVLPGQYRFTLTGFPEGWSVASAMFEGRDAADHHLQIDGTRNLTGLEITLTSQRTELSGTLTRASGPPAPEYTVLIFPADRRLWLPQSRRIRLAAAGPDGRYSLRGLPAGEYRLAALLDPDPGREFDPELLSQIFASSIALALGPGETKVQDLRVK